MSKELAAKILNEHLWMGSEPSAPQEAILKAMEQYGLEQSKDGYKTAALAEHYRSVGEIDRLRELVKAQKELIDWYELKIELYPLQQKETDPLFNRIKQLES